MRVIRVVFGLLLITSFFSSVQATTFEMPANFSVNPQNLWSVEYAAGATWSSKADLNLMQEGLLWGTEPVWATPNGQFIPRVQRNSSTTTWLVSGNPIVNSAAVLVFQAPSDGLYSIDLTWLSAWGSTDTTVEYLDVRSAVNAQSTASILWQTSHTWVASQQYYYDDLSALTALQNINLTAGSYIFFSMSSYPHPGLPIALNQFLTNDGTGEIGGSIHYAAVPEPATVLLMSIGGIFASFRRNRN